MAEFFRTFLIVIGVAAALGLVGMFLLDRRLRALKIPEGASFRETLQRVPFGLVVVLDLLDLGLDIFAAPIVWVWLGRYNLRVLRQVSLVEALIPFTQVIPTLTAAWLAVRWFDPAMRQPTISSSDRDQQP
ncbi:MAG TPA: hypothetical protein VGE07_14685 [Herpetosiphonaceae bacterium]